MPRRKQDSESENQSNAKRQKGEDCDDATVQDTEWTVEEKEMLLVELEKKGWKNLEWSALQQKVKSKTEDQIKKLSAQLKVQRQVIESATMDAKDTTPLRVWSDFASQMSDPADAIAAQCIPQVMAVASMEERRYEDLSGNQCPDFRKIYSFLARLLKGEASADQLNPVDAVVILEFMDDIDSNLKESFIDLQLENMMRKYNALPRKGKEMLYKAISSANSGNNNNGVTEASCRMSESFERTYKSASATMAKSNGNQTTILSEMSNQHKSSVEQVKHNPGTSSDRTHRNLRPLLPRGPLPQKAKKGPKSSSLNPLKIPVNLLNFKKKQMYKEA